MPDWLKSSSPKHAPQKLSGDQSEKIEKARQAFLDAEQQRLFTQAAQIQTGVRILRASVYAAITAGELGPEFQTWLRDELLKTAAMLASEEVAH